MSGSGGLLRYVLEIQAGSWASFNTSQPYKITNNTTGYSFSMTASYSACEGVQQTWNSTTYESQSMHLVVWSDATMNSFFLGPTANNAYAWVAYTGTGKSSIFLVGATDGATPATDPFPAQSGFEVEEI